LAQILFNDESDTSNEKFIGNNSILNILVKAAMEGNPKFLVDMLLRL
jgi:hypothetical protein